MQDASDEVRPVNGRPMVGLAEVAAMVHRAHEDGIQAVLGAPGQDGPIDRDALEAIFTYCAERRCEADGVACGGCRRDIERQGIRSLSDYCARFSRIDFRDGGLSIIGPDAGGPSLKAESLDALARGWGGEEYWFWARRVLRKVRFGVRESEQLFARDTTTDDAPAAVLVAPQIAENIGMVARAMANFGLDDLRVVAPRDGWPSEKARSVASGAAAILDGARLTSTLEEAIADCQYVVATTARQRDMRKPILTPEAAASEMRRRARAGQRCAIVYGRERNGLTSDEVAMANAVVMIPVNPQFASLNLAQAVLLTSYAWLRSGDDATLGRVTVNDRRLEQGLHLGHDVPAKHDDVLRFFEHLEDELEARGFFTPIERKPVTVRNLRSMFLRMGPTAQEVRTLRGMIVTLSRRLRQDREPGD